MTARLLRQFLEAGIRPGPALKTLNAALSLRGETGFLAGLQPGDALFVPMTVILLVVVVIIAGLYVRTFKKS